MKFLFVNNLTRLLWPHHVVGADASGGSGGVQNAAPMPDLSPYAGEPGSPVQRDTSVAAARHMEADAAQEEEDAEAVDQEAQEQDRLMKNKSEQRNPSVATRAAAAFCDEKHREGMTHYLSGKWHRGDLDQCERTDVAFAEEVLLTFKSDSLSHMENMPVMTS